MVDLQITLPDRYLEEEVRCGYLVTSEVKGLWAVCLDLLESFKKVCAKYHLRYFAAYGTLIGAMRHNGFIPWDDDLDLVMPRKDYEELCRHAEEFKYPYFLQMEKNDVGFSRPFARLRNSETTAVQKIEDFGKRIHYNQGIFIDIFPIDSFPDDEKDLELFVSKTTQLKNKMLKFSRWSTRYIRYQDEKSRLKIKEKVRYFISLILQFSMERLKLQNPYVRQLDKASQSFNDSNTGLCGVPYIWKAGKKWVWKKEWFEETIEVPFEMISISVPKNYDEILSTIYGNWREFVVGKNTHGELLFDTSVSYKEFIKRLQ